MSDELRACPACGGRDIRPDDNMFRGARPFQDRCAGCGVCGPCGETREEAAAAWNALPRREWIPAATPPEVPEGKTHIAVQGWCPAGYAPGYVGTAVYGEGEWMEPYPSHWQHLPPGPGEGGR